MGIIIEWDDSIEYFDHIDPDNLDGLQAFNTTIEWLCKQRVPVNPIVA